MSTESPLTYEAFLYLAKEAGLDAASPHMEELYPYVQAALRALEPLKRIDVSDVEPDMAFMPLPGQPHQ